MSDIKTTLFPNGAPCDSILDVHNNNIFGSDKIAAVYLVNGGPDQSQICFMKIVSI